MKIKLITLNIWHGGVLFDNAVEFLQQEKPDILCLQEVYDGHDQSLERRFRTMEELQQRLPWLSYSEFAPTMIDSTTKTPWGNAVFSKFEILENQSYLFSPPIVEHEFVVENDPLAKESRQGMLEAKIKIGEREVYVFSLHGVWDTHGEDTPKRFEMEKIITDAIKEKDTVILAGDTNLNPGTEVEAKIKGYLVSVFGESIKSTFNMRRKKYSGFATAVVDMVFVSRNIKVLSKDCPDVDISDHLPLIVQLEI